MRRREAGRGAVPAGRFRKIGTRAAPELRPGPLRGPARSWLTTVGSISNAIRPSLNKERGAKTKRRGGPAGHLRRKRGPAFSNRRDWRAERRPRGPRKDRDTIGLRLSARHPLIGEEGQRPVSKERGASYSTPGRPPVAATRSHVCASANHSSLFPCDLRAKHALACLPPLPLYAKPDPALQRGRGTNYA